MRVKHSLKRLTSLLLCLVMLMQMVVVASAAGFSPKTETPEPTAADAFEFSKGTITDYVGSDANVVIPAAIDGTPVTAIGQGAFMAKDIENVVIPSTVTYVGDYAFDYCDDLDGLYFYGDVPSNLESATYDMNTDVTIYCKSTYLSDYEYEVGNYFSVSGGIKGTLADPAYPAAPSHNWVYTDNGDGTHSAKCADEGCTDVITNEAHDFSKGNCVCGAKADGSKPEMFNYKVLDESAKTAAIIGYNSTGLGGEITLPGTYTKDGVTYTVTTVAADAFNGNGNNSNTDAEALSKITKITVPASITTVEARGFNYVGRYASKLWQLKEIVFEAENVTFGVAALGGNPNLTSITFPAKLTKISGSMFAKNTALTTLTIPASVTEIDTQAFSGCTALTEVNFKSVTPPTMAKTTSYPSGNYPFAGLTQKVTLNVPADYLTEYTTAWADMISSAGSSSSSKAGNITVVGNGEADDEPVVASISDFKVYLQNDKDEDTDKYLEYRVVSFDNKTKTGTVELKYVGYNKDGGTLTIPETVTTKVLNKDWSFTVVGIGENAMFSYEMPSTSSNYWFATVNFPSTLEYIAKSGCWSLDKVTEIDLSNTKVERIGSMAFYGCKKAGVIKLPATLESMGGTVTGSSKNITAIPGKNDTVGDTGDAKIDVKEEPETYTDNIFACCDALKEIIVDPANPNFKDVDGILYSKDGKKLIRYPNARPDTHFDIPEGVEVIASQAFMQSYTGNSALETVTFPSSLKEIESLAFRQSSLTSVTLPGTLEKVGSSAFDISKKLASLTIEEGVKELGDYAFWSCEALTTVKFPASLKKVGNSCFGHSGLTSVDLGSVEEIGSYAFYYTQLNEVTIPATVKDAGIASFCNIKTLTKATFKAGAKDVGNFMFFYDTALSDVTLADSITNVGEYAFGYCVALEEVTMPRSLATMGDAVFYKAWKSLKTVIFPDEVQITSLPASTFESCQALTYVYLGKNITSTGPVSLYDTNRALKVDCVVSEDNFERNIFDVFPYDLTDKSLFTAWEATDDKDDYGYPVYKAWLNPEAFTGGGGCGGGSVKEGDYVLFYAGAAPAFTYGEAKGNPVLTLSVTGCDGKVETIDIYKSDLLNLADTDVVVYQYWPPVNMGGGANAIVGTKYVTIEKLLNAYGIDTFADGDTLNVIPNDNRNLSVNKTELDTCKYYFDADGVRNEVPAALLLTWNTGKLADKDGKILTTVEELANSAYDSGNIRFGYGVSQEQYDNRNTTGLRGIRLVSNVTTLSFTQVHAYVDVPADAGDEYLFSAATCTENAKYYSKICKYCDELAEPVEKAGTALGQKWGEGVVTVLPTIDKEGVMTYTCSVCSTTKTEPIAKLASSDTDQSAANEVINLINSIGKVSKSSKDAIEAARKAYNALTPEQQALVKASGALKTLQKAEAAYKQLTTTGGSSSGSTSDGKNGTTDKTVKSGKTGDMGIAVYAAMSLLSLTGGAWVVKKNRKVR